jgi:hypothetical protein
MDVAPPLRAALGDALRAFAAQQGVSTQKAERRAFVTGIVALSRPIDRACIPVLGKFQLPITANGTISLHSPILVGGPQPRREPIKQGSPAGERDTHAL